MIHLSTILNESPNWEKAHNIDTTPEGIQIRILEKEKKIYSVLPIPIDKSLEDISDLSFACRMYSLHFFIKQFPTEPFAEIWNFSNKKEVIYEARTPLLTKKRISDLIASLSKKSPLGYKVINSLKGNNPNGILELEDLARNTARKSELVNQNLDSEDDTIDTIIIDRLYNEVFASFGDLSSLSDALKYENIEKLSNELQFLANKVKSSAIDLVRHRVGRPNPKKKRPKVKYIYHDNTEEVIIDENQLEYDILVLTKLYESFKLLTQREEEIIQLLYYEDLNGAEIAKKLGISEQRVSRIKNSALRKLRQSNPN